MKDGKEIKVVYISGPITAPTRAERVKNVHKAIEVFLYLVNCGYSPVCPHLFHYAAEHAILCETEFLRCPSWADWMRVDLDHLERCDALLFLGSSKGADIEYRRAVELGMPIFEDWLALGEMKVMDKEAVA